MTNYATFEILSADVSTEFGRTWATKLFGEDVVALLPVKKAGKNKGDIKAFVHWTKVSRGGWSRQYGVMTPGVNNAWLTESSYAGATPISGRLNGRTQEFRLPRSYLFEEGRARMAAERKAQDEHLRQLRMEELEEAVELLARCGRAASALLNAPPHESIPPVLAQLEQEANARIVQVEKIMARL